MHHQDQTITHTPGNENHGVYVCHKCGWPFPNPHPSAKHRRAHKKICGTIEGYKEEPTNFNGSDDDYKTPGLVELGSNNDGIERKFSRSESEVYSDAVDDFPDTGLSQGVKHNLQQEHTLNSAADVSPLIASSSNDCQIKNPKIMQSESFEVGNIGGTQGQLSGSTVDPLTSSIADSKNEESSIVHDDGFSGLSSDSSLGIDEAVPNLLPEKNIYAGENVTDCSLVCDEKELNLKGTDEVKSEKDRVEIMESTDNIVGETYEGTPKVVVNEAISLDHDMGNEAVNPKEKKGPGSLSLLPQYEFPQEVNSSIITNEAQVESAHAIHSTSNEVEVLPEKEDVNVNIDPLPVHDDKFDAAYPQSVSLKHEEHVTEENNFHFNTSQLSERSGVLSSEMHVMDNDTKTENIHAEDCSEVSLVELTTETYQISHEIGVSTKTEMDENDFPEEHEPDEIHENSQPESSLMVSANEFQREASFRAKVAMEMAVSDINSDPTILSETNLNLIMKDGMCNAFLGSTGAFQVLEQGVAAIIGPQSSAIAHSISQIADAVHVPLISYAATDPTLSSLQFPLFFRTIQSDSEQMAAMANLIDFNGWKEVIVIFLDDDYGRNGISALSDELEKRRLKLAHKLPLSIHYDLDEITKLLNQSRVYSPRVFVVHVNPDPRLRIFSIARKLQMMTSDYVWLATDWLSATLHSFSSANQNSLSIVEGVVALRQHVPDSRKKRDFISRWKKMQKGVANTSLNSYGFFAYDTVWTIAHSIDKYLKVYNNITFSLHENNMVPHTEGIGIQFEKLKVFAGGSNLVNILLQSNFRGLSGQIRFSSDRNIISSGYDVININQMKINKVGYWSNHSGFSALPPEVLAKKKHRRVSVDQKLGNITWPGGKTERPRGWVIADNAKPLRIGVPKRASFVEFVTEVQEIHQMQGYCIDIFMKALEFIPYEIPFVFKPVGNGKANPNYDALVKKLDENVYDAVVGDIAIVTNRTKIADFSQPFASSSLVVVAPINSSKSNAWVFLKPFSPDMWCIIVASFMMIGVVIWILEHRVNDDFRGPPKRQLVTMFMFSLSTLFKTNNNTISSLSKMVLIVWLFLLMVITASYTASLTSILTVEQLSSPITGIDSLIASNWPIGYQVGSFAYSYLTDNLYVSSSRLVSLGSPEEYAVALRNGPSGGGVAAIVDELPYVELFLSKETDFGIIGQPFTRSSWGFAFQRESPLALDMSTAILKLAESGELQNIHEKWFCKMGCPDERKRNSKPDQLHLSSFWGLYLSCGIISVLALVLFLLRMISQYVGFKQSQNEVVASSSKPPESHCSRVVVNFFNFIDKKEDAIKKMFTQCDNPHNPNSEL